MQQTQSGIEACVEEYRNQNPRSRALYERALKIFPAGNTRASVFFEPFPTYMVRGEGCRAWDVDGNERIDFLNNYTSLIHGHRAPQVMAALEQQLGRGTSFASPTEHELQLAELIQQRVPSLERLRFTSSGTEATLMAIRTARAFTGRDKIAKIEGGFHGAHEHVQISISPNLDQAGPEDHPVGLAEGPGIPQNVLDNVVVIPFNNPAAIERILDPIAGSVAAIMVEPVMGAGGIIKPSVGFLAFLREYTRRHQMLLIFDEVIAFRLSFNGAQGYFGVTPDLTSLGKIIGGGLPVGGFGGRADIMAVFESPRGGGVTHPGTFNGYPPAMVAGIATLEALTPDSFSQLEQSASRMAATLESLFAKHQFPAQVTQIGSLFNIHTSTHPISNYRTSANHNIPLKQALHLGLLNHGFVLAPRGMGCLSTVIGQSEIDSLVQAVESVIGIIG